MPLPTKDELDAAVAGQTVASRFLDTVNAHGERVALRWKNADDSWGEMTYRDYADAAARAAAGLAALGVKRGDRVLLMMRNRPEFHAADMGALFVGATPVSVYNSSSPEQIQYLASHSEASVAIVEDIGFLERVLKVRDELPALKHLVIIDDPQGLAGSDVAKWSDFCATDPVDIGEAAKIAQPEDLATVIYTSGTTGPPKGVMLTHYNIVFTAQGYLGLLRGDLAGFRAVSYLPMAHIAERMTGHYLAALGALEVTTCPDPGGLAVYLREVRPQTFFGVPRVWEKLHAAVSGALAADPDKAKQFADGVAAAIPLREARTAGTLDDEQAATLQFLDDAAFAGVRANLGLDQCEIAVTGAAPIPVDILNWFRAIGVPLSEIYGMSESTGPMTWDPYEVRVGTVGRAFPGCDVQLLEDGEVVCRGGNVFKGYLNDPEKTAEALDDEGWLHSGDIGVMEDGYVKIVDRKKELIITAGGKNISPANLEAALKSLPLIGQACVIGDNKPFIERGTRARR